MKVDVFLEKSMKIVFVVLIDTNHFLVHEFILSRSSLIILAAYKISLFTTLKILSSSTNRKLSLFKSLQISLITIKNNNDRGTDPCGTPAFSSFKSDETQFKTSYCLLLDRYDVSNFCKFPLITHFVLFYKEVICATLYQMLL